MFKAHGWVLLDVIFQDIRLNGTQGKEEKVVCSRTKLPSDVCLTVHRNSVWIRNQLDITFELFFISPLQVSQYVSGKHVPIFSS